MKTSPFTILVPFNGKMSLANVTEVDHAVERVFDVELSGYKTQIVITRHGASTNDAGYAEDKATDGKTEFSAAIGKAIETYAKDGYEPFTIEIDGKNYVALGCNDTVAMEEHYSIYQDGGKLFELHMNDAGEFEVDEESSDPAGNFDEAFCKQNKLRHTGSHRIIVPPCLPHFLKNTPKPPPTIKSS